MFGTTVEQILTNVGNNIMATPLKIQAKKLGITVTELRRRLKAEKNAGNKMPGNQPMKFRAKAKAALNEWVQDFRAVEANGFPLDAESKQHLQLLELAVEDKLEGIMAVSAIANLAANHVYLNQSPDLVAEANTVLDDISRSYTISGQPGFMQVTAK